MFADTVETLSATLGTGSLIVSVVGTGGSGRSLVKRPARRERDVLSLVLPV